MIDFSCPTCQAQIRVADGAGGKKGTCPSCKSKVVVPDRSETEGQSSLPGSGPKQPSPNPPFEFKPAETPPNFEAQDQGVTQDSVADVDSTTAPLIDIKPEDKPGATVRRSRRRRKKSSGGGLVVPLICVAILLGFVGWYFWQTQAGLSPDVVGEVVENPQIPDGLIAYGNVSVGKSQFEKVRQSLEAQPLSLVSRTYLADVTLTGSISGIVTKVEPVKGAVCVKVSLDGTEVEDYVADRAKELNEYRMTRIRESADKFIPELIAAVDAGKREIPNLDDVRNDMALASVVSGFGYHVVAWDGKTASPCVGVDQSGDLYFFVKPGTKQFIIRGRELEGDTPGFPGEIVVKVPATEKIQPKPAQSSTPDTPPEPEEADSETEETDNAPEEPAAPDDEKPDPEDESEEPPDAQ